MVSVSTTAKAGGRHADRLVWWFLGFLKVLLGKPGTLHSLGHSFPSALGVPPDLREASGFRRVVKNHGRVGMWLRLHRSRGSFGCASVTRQGSVPPPKRMWDRLATRLPCHSLLIIYVPLRELLCHFLASRMYARYIPLCHFLASRMYGSGGEGPAGSFGACTPPHRQLLCGVAGSLFLPLYRSGF